MTPNVRVMYLRPGNLFKEFLIESNDETIGESGRPEISYSEETRTLKGCLANATEGDRERWKQLQHPITHTIVQRGHPKATPEDKLIFGERVFLIHAVDDCGGLGISTIYYAEERLDVR